MDDERKKSSSTSDNDQRPNPNFIFVSYERKFDGNEGKGFNWGFSPLLLLLPLLLCFTLLQLFNGLVVVVGAILSTINLSTTHSSSQIQCIHVSPEMESSHEADRLCGFGQRVNERFTHIYTTDTLRETYATREICMWLFWFSLSDIFAVVPNTKWFGLTRAYVDADAGPFLGWTLSSSFALRSRPVHESVCVYVLPKKRHGLMLNGDLLPINAPSTQQQ